jgi:DNA-3-methyladenine glycosylase
MMIFDELDVKDVDTMAQRLLGCELRRTLQDGYIIGGAIVEVEAYDQTDAASHSFRGITKRTKIMFGPSGYSYVYFTYGMHYCMNIVVGPEGYGAAVLIRALQLTEGVEFARENRPPKLADEQLANGPAKLCQALLINKELNGHDLRKPPLELIGASEVSAGLIVNTTRIGISQEKDRLRRFYIKGNSYVSKL